MNIATVAYDTDEEIVDSDEEECKREGALQHVPAPLTLDPRTLVTSTYPLDHSAYPAVGNINVDNKSVLHIGPKIDYIVQNVDNSERVKGHFLGLELISLRGQSRAVRCSIAVFVCWALLISVGLVVYLVCLSFTTDPTRLELGINETWYLQRDKWQALKPNSIEFLNLPVSNVIIGHSGLEYCDRRNECIELVLETQKLHLSRRWADIGPNFLVGGNGLVFEGRGGNVVSAMLSLWNKKCISVMFLGDYRTVQAEEVQFENVQTLLDVLVDKGALAKNYQLYGQCQITSEISPGNNVVDKLYKLKNWDSSNVSRCP